MEYNVYVLDPAAKQGRFLLFWMRLYTNLNEIKGLKNKLPLSYFFQKTDENILLY